MSEPVPSLQLDAEASNISAEPQGLGQTEASKAPPEIGANENVVDPDLKRPRSWQEVRELVSFSLKAYPESVTIRDWMDSFQLMTFDQQARAIITDAQANLLMNPDQPNEFRYEPALYESTIRTAAGQLDRCLAYRNEMGEYEIAGISAGRSYLTFLEVGPLQLSLLDEANRADLELIEKRSSQLAIDNYNTLPNIERKPVDDVYVAGLRQEAQGALSKAELNVSRENAIAALLKEQLKILRQAQSEQFLRFTSPGSSANFSERYLRLARLLEEDLSDAFCGLVSVSKGVQALLSGLNTTFTTFPLSASTKVDVQIPKLDTDDAITLWTRAFSDRRPVGFPAVKEATVDILDALVLWCRGLMRELDRRAQYESEFTISIPLGYGTGQMGATPLINNILKELNDNNGVLKFNLQENALPATMTGVPIRVVGIGLSVQESEDDAVPIDHVALYPSVVPPAGIGSAQKDFARRVTGYRMARINALVQTPEQLIELRTYNRPQVFLPEVRLYGGISGEAEAKISYDPSCHNLRPFGGWTIKLDKAPLLYVPSTELATWSWVRNVIIHLRLRGRFK